MATATEVLPANPLSGLYDFVRQHLLIANNVVLASATLVAILDFMAPRLSLAPTIVYSATAALLMLMIAAAIAPALVGRLISALGHQARRPDTPLWRKPLWQFSVAILLGVSVVGFASVARASQGGLIAGSIPAARSLQEAILGLRQDVGDIRTGVESANAKLDGMAERSADPRRDLASLGYAIDANGLMKAIRQDDRRAVALFARSAIPIGTEGPLSVLLSGAQPWDNELASILPASMFAGREACKAGRVFSREAKDPVAERVAAFKRLCDTKPTIDSLRVQIENDAASPPLNEEMARQREARKRNLKALSG